MNTFRDQLKVEGVNARGFGTVPKMVMLDKKLTIEAKAIYSYFCSYAGAGTTAFPSTKKIQDDLCVGKARYYKHFNLLKDFGYIRVEQKRDEKGVFKHNIYTLIQNPEPVLNKKESEEIIDEEIVNKTSVPSTQNRTSDENGGKSTFYPSTQNRDTDNRYTENRDTNINNLYKTNNLLYNQSVYQEKDRLTDRTIFNKILLNAEINENKFPLKFLYIEKAVEYLYFSKDPLNINGVEINTEQRQKELINLNSYHIEMALEAFDEQLEKQIIKNKLGYLAICIYNAIYELDLKIRNDIKYYQG